MRAILFSLSPWLAVGRLHHAAPTVDASDIGAFQSDNGHYCGQSDARTVEAALALKKAGVHGKAFIRAIAWQATCEALNYTHYGGEDICYPGLHVYYKNQREQADYAIQEARWIVDFAGKFNLPQDKTALLAACSCHPKSFAMRSVEGRCQSVESIRGSWVHRHPHGGQALICVEGAFKDTVYSLASLKASIQLPMHAFDQAMIYNCTWHGFKEKFDQPDHCYPKMRLWTKTVPIQSDEGIKQSNEVEEHLFKSGEFVRWAVGERRNAQVLATTAGCNCLPNSEVGKRNRHICSNPARRPPINDWYVE
uniref:Uncharacterized protein n=1 Tax=Alexandrium catenella TaxID=2925 RepID=A0A7S1PY38_ALECA